ncbi:hypothetical protein ZWY2020_050887 [Hordeum vulgare]|nr:hypothetical protein ZWY2020_050887 [Hordeum vulgare]
MEPAMALDTAALPFALLPIRRGKGSQPQPPPRSSRPLAPFVGHLVLASRLPLLSLEVPESAAAPQPDLPHTYQHRPLLFSSGSVEAMVRLDINEFMERHTVARQGSSATLPSPSNTRRADS